MGSYPLPILESCIAVVMTLMRSTGCAWLLGASFDRNQRRIEPCPALFADFGIGLVYVFAEVAGHARSPQEERFFDSLIHPSSESKPSSGSFSLPSHPTACTRRSR